MKSATKNLKWFGHGGIRAAASDFIKIWWKTYKGVFMDSNLQDIILEQIESLLEEQKAVSNGKMKVAAFLNKANTLLTIDKYIDELNNWDKSVIDPAKLKSFHSEWDRFKANVNLQ
jgi:hypothetical protein